VKRVLEIEERHLNVRVVRDRDMSSKRGGKRIRCLELHPAFLESVRDDWNIMSLGQYLSQLRPANDDCEKFLKKELELTMGKALLTTLGTKVGAGLLPILGLSSADEALSNAASKMATYAADMILSDVDTAAKIVDSAALDIDVAELISVLNINQKVNTPSLLVPSALQKFKVGEAGYGDLSFHNEEKYENGFPSPFVMEHDFKNFIFDMEGRIAEKNGNYDPDDKSLPVPTPINERLLPDLYSGAGNAKCTHSKRECLENRLISFLFTRLSYNFTKIFKGENDLFQVQWNGKSCMFPEELLQAFIENGHTVDICPKVTLAVFGVFLCVKERDSSFSNIPICYQIRTGIEHSSDGRPSYFLAPHGGLEINISGPLVGSTNYCAVQFYVSAPEGMTAFFANEDADVPWLDRQPLSRMYSYEEAISSVRMAGMVAHVFNSIGTDFNLPSGGYGVLGMCNDTSAIIDFAVRGETSAYPLLGTGRYLNHIFNYFLALKEVIQGKPNMKSALFDLNKLIKAITEMPTDTCCSFHDRRHCCKILCNSFQLYISKNRRE